MNNRLLFLLLLVLPANLFAQPNYKEGLVITFTGDTLKGFVNYRAWFQNPETILFKRALEDKNAEEFTASNTASFSVPGYASYISSTVSISMNEVDFGSLRVEADTTQLIKTVFLKQLLKGDRVSMYLYRDKIKERFYIVSKDEKLPRELLYSKTLQNLQEFRNESYKQQLRSLAIENNVLNEELDGSIMRTEYTEDQLKKLLKKFNSNIEEDKIQQVEKKPRMRYFVNVGINRSRIKYTGESLVTIDRLNSNGMDNFKDEVTTQSFMPVFSAGMDLYTNPEMKRLVIRFELFATTIKSSTTSYSKLNEISTHENENKYRLSALKISLAPQLIYNFYRTNHINCYVGGGVALNLLRVGDNSMEQKPINHSNTNPWTDNDYFLLKDYFASTMLRCGLQYGERIDCSFLWGNSQEYTNTVSGESIKTGLLMVSVGYLMNKGKK